MRKIALGLLFLSTSVLSFGQAIWSGTATISTSVYLNGSNTSAGQQSVDVSEFGEFGPVTGSARFGGGDFGSYYYEFNFANGDSDSLQRNSGGNLRLYMNNQDGPSLSIPNGTLKFEIFFPMSTTGVVTGVSVVSDTYGIFNNFTVTSNGAGLLTFTQIAAIDTVGNAENLELNFTTSAAVPEPSTYAALAGLAVFGLAVAVRRRSVAGV